MDKRDRGNGKGNQVELRAVNQQLRAANEQLMASEQQLRAANQQLKATEQELQKSRLRYKSMFEGASHAIAVFECLGDGSDFVFRNFNPAAERLEGVKRQDVLGKSVLEVLRRARQSGLFDVFRKVYKTGRAGQHYETEYEKGRVTKWRENYVFKLPSGEIVASYEDITRRKQAEETLAEEHNLLRTLIDNLPDSIYVKDTKSRFVLANTEVASRVGAGSAEELIGRTDFDFHSKEAAERFYADEQQVIRSGKPVHYREEQFLNKATGRTIWNLTTKVPLYDTHGKIVGIIGIGRDITKLKQTQNELNAANQQLMASEQQLKAANQQLMAANQQLRATEQQLRAANQQLAAGQQQLNAANQQLAAGQQQLRAANQQLGAANQQLRATEEQLRKLNDKLNERVKKLNCLHNLSRLVEKRELKVEQVLGQVVTLLVPAWQWPDVACARIIFEGMEFKTDNFRQTQWSQSADIKIDGRVVGSVEVCYLKERPEADEGPFLKEERRVIEDVAERLTETVERRRAEQKLEDYQRQLKSLASELTISEERERRRIAIELHDKISQLLVISKVKLEALHKSGKPEDIKRGLAEACNSLDETIENARLLTFDLSSPILHELGFEAAVSEWLSEQIEAKYGIATEFIDDKQAKPLDDDVRVLLFRDVRELLINVIKHAKASKVTVSIRKINGNIRVIVQDNGVGFDPDVIPGKATKRGGFGLFSIKERLEQLGGHLEVKSKPGSGCKVTLTAPLKYMDK